LFVLNLYSQFKLEHSVFCSRKWPRSSRMGCKDGR